MICRNSPELMKCSSSPTFAKCRITGCDREIGIQIHRLCYRHYKDFKAKGYIVRPYPDECEVKDCENKHYGLGLCEKHYARKRRGLKPDYNKKQPHKICTIEGCGTKHHAHGLCKKHYDQTRTR